MDRIGIIRIDAERAPEIVFSGSPVEAVCTNDTERDIRFRLMRIETQGCPRLYLDLDVNAFNGGSAEGDRVEIALVKKIHRNQTIDHRQERMRWRIVGIVLHGGCEDGDR